MFLYLWVTETTSKNIRSYLQLFVKTMTDVQHFFWRMLKALISMQVEELQIGRERVIVEINETLLSKKTKLQLLLSNKRNMDVYWDRKGNKKWFGQVILKRNR